MKYIDTGALPQTWGAGHFLVLNWTGVDKDVTSLMVGLEPSMGSGLVEAYGDPDHNGVFKITNVDQKFVMLMNDGTKTGRVEYDLSDLVLEPSGN